MEGRLTIATNEMIKDVEHLLNLPMGSLLSKSRADLIFQARSIICVYLNTFKHWNPPVICEVFKQHRTTIIHALKTAEHRIKHDKYFKCRYDSVINYLAEKYGAGMEWKIYG